MTQVIPPAIPSVQKIPYKRTVQTKLALEDTEKNNHKNSGESMKLNKQAQKLPHGLHLQNWFDENIQTNQDEDKGAIDTLLSREKRSSSDDT